MSKCKGQAAFIMYSRPDLTAETGLSLYIYAIPPDSAAGVNLNSKRKDCFESAPADFI